MMIGGVFWVMFVSFDVSNVVVFDLFMVSLRGSVLVSRMSMF